MTDLDYSTKKAARMRVCRAYMGLDIDEMANQLGVQLRSYQRWESGVAPIPEQVWTDVEAMMNRFDDLIDSIIDSPDPHVRVPRKGESMLRAVSIALRERPELEPMYDSPTRPRGAE